MQHGGLVSVRADRVEAVHSSGSPGEGTNVEHAVLVLLSGRRVYLDCDHFTALKHLGWRE